MTPRAWKHSAATVERVTANRVLLVITYRPEFEPPWIGRPHVTALTLNRLGQREIANLIDHHLATSHCQRPLDRTFERTDGIPLFVGRNDKKLCWKQRAKTMHCKQPPPFRLLLSPSRQACTPRRWRGSRRLGPAKEVAQTGAVIGMLCWLRWCANLEAELQTALYRLVAAGLLFRQGNTIARELSVQARTCTGCCIRHIVARCATGRAALSHRRVTSKANSASSREPAGTARASLQRGRTDPREGRAQPRGKADSDHWRARPRVGARALDQIATLPATPAFKMSRTNQATVTPTLHLEVVALSGN